MNKRSGHERSVHKRNLRGRKRTAKKSTHGYRKGSKSKTMKGKKDFTTKKSSKVFNRRRHYQKHAKGSRVNRRPYHKTGGGKTHYSPKLSKLSAAPVKSASAAARAKSAAVSAKSSHVPTKRTDTTSRKLMTAAVPKYSPKWTEEASRKELLELFPSSSDEAANLKLREAINAANNPKAGDDGFSKDQLQVAADLADERNDLMKIIKKNLDLKDSKIVRSEALSQIRKSNANALEKKNAIYMVNLIAELGPTRALKEWLKWTRVSVDLGEPLPRLPKLPYKYAQT